MKRLVVLLTSLMLIAGAAACASASAEAGILGIDYSIERQGVSAYGTLPLTDDFRIGAEYSGASDIVLNVLYQVAGGGLSSLDVGIGLSATTPIRAYLVLQGVNYVSPKAFLHSSVAYKVSPAPSDLSWSIGVGYDFSDNVFGKVTYRSNSVLVGFGLRF